MQDDNLLQNTFLVQAGVVGGAMLLLLIIIAYLHFDEKISNFFGNCQKGTSSSHVLTNSDSTNLFHEIFFGFLNGCKVFNLTFLYRYFDLN